MAIFRKSHPLQNIILGIHVGFLRCMICGVTERDPGLFGLKSSFWLQRLFQHMVWVGGVGPGGVGFESG